MNYIHATLLVFILLKYMSNPPRKLVSRCVIHNWAKTNPFHPKFLLQQKTYWYKCRKLDKLHHKYTELMRLYNKNLIAPISDVGNHVPLTDVHNEVAKAIKNQTDSQAKEIFLPFRTFCTRKDIKTNEIITEDSDVARALCDYVKINLIDTLVVGSPSRNSFVRFKTSDVPTSVSRGAPEFCNVYVISKGKISSVRSASIAVPTQQSRLQNQNIPAPAPRPTTDGRSFPTSTSRAADRIPFGPRTPSDDQEIKSPFNRNRESNRSYGDLSMVDTDISFVSSNRPSTDRMGGGFSSPFDRQEMGPTLRLSLGLDNRNNFMSPLPTPKSQETSYMKGFSSSDEETSTSWPSSNKEDVEAEMRRLKQELKQTMDMYSSACKEALSAKQKAMELHRWKMEEEHRLEEARQAEEAAMAIVEQEKAKTKAAIEAAEAAQRIAEREAQKRINAEMKALKEAEEKDKVLNTLAQNDNRYRKYTIEEIEAATDHFADSRKIGEGGYGPVYKCFLDHTPVAIKVLRPDAAQGRSQFQQEVEVLTGIRHPNMVLLLGACPEYGCLVYEFMANGSLEDCLFRRGKTGVLPWQLRFRIAAEIGTGLLFLHQSKPEPLVHRDLKPGNILLDRNFVSKISDVGLARLVPPSVANTVTQYRMTSTAGTFCYIDPEYQQTGMLGIKSDIYSLGIMLLQMVTGKPPMGLTHHVERTIERGTFKEMLDPAIPDCPVEEAMKFAKLALKCAELRRKDRPDLKTVILPELNRLRTLAEENMPTNIMMLGCGTNASSPSQSNDSSVLSHVSSDHEIIRDPMLRRSRAGSSPSNSSPSKSYQKPDQPPL